MLDHQNLKSFSKGQVNFPYLGIPNNLENAENELTMQENLSFSHDSYIFILRRIRHTCYRSL